MARESGATAIGANTIVRSSGGTAIGLGAVVEAAASGSIALGQNSVASRPNTVSVGSPGSERTISNVAPGVYGTDAVNMNQLQNAINGVQYQVNVNKAGIASVAAATNIPGLATGQTWSMGLGYGNYLGYNGVAIGGQVRVGDNVVVKISGSSASGVYSGGAGFGISF